MRNDAQLKPWVSRAGKAGLRGLDLDVGLTEAYCNQWCLHEHRRTWRGGTAVGRKEDLARVNSRERGGAENKGGPDVGTTIGSGRGENKGGPGVGYL